MRRFNDFALTALALCTGGLLPLQAAVAATTSATAVAAAACSARSGPARAVLVELYTSEGCSSCPPADAQLAQLTRLAARSGDSPVVPLAWHVPYWDSIGWKDPYAQQAFAARQRWLVAANQARTVYTPHYFVSGHEALDWRDQLAPAMKQMGSPPPAAQVSLQVQPAANGVSVLAEVQPLAERAGAGAAADWQLHVALSENGLVSAIQAGENRGATLHHDHVVRQWLGPYALSPTGAGNVRRDIALNPQWRRDRLELSAFVQNARTGEVLQAVALPLCATP